MNEIPEDESVILDKINRREANVLGKGYSMMYPELYHYAYSLHKNKDDAKDAIHDAFLYLWEHDKIQFDSLAKMKSYLYVLMRNDFVSRLRKNKVQQEYAEGCLYEKDYYMYQAAEAEIFTIIPTALKMLPEECARVLKLLLEGWNLREISEKTGTPLSTVHFLKGKAISILRTKLDKDKLLLLMSFLSSVSTLH